MSLPPINRLKVLVTGQRGGITSDLIALQTDVTTKAGQVSAAVPAVNAARDAAVVVVTAAGTAQAASLGAASLSAILPAGPRRISTVDTRVASVAGDTNGNSTLTVFGDPVGFTGTLSEVRANLNNATTVDLQIIAPGAGSTYILIAAFRTTVNGRGAISDRQIGDFPMQPNYRIGIKVVSGPGANVLKAGGTSPFFTASTLTNVGDVATPVGSGYIPDITFIKREIAQVNSVPGRTIQQPVATRGFTLDAQLFPGSALPTGYTAVGNAVFSVAGGLAATGAGSFGTYVMKPGKTALARQSFIQRVTVNATNSQFAFGSNYNSSPFGTAVYVDGVANTISLGQWNGASFSGTSSMPIPALQARDYILRVDRYNYDLVVTWTDAWSGLVLATFTRTFGYLSGACLFFGSPSFIHVSGSVIWRSFRQQSNYPRDLHALLIGDSNLDGTAGDTTAAPSWGFRLAAMRGEKNIAISAVQGERNNFQSERLATDWTPFASIRYGVWAINTNYAVVGGGNAQWRIDTQAFINLCLAKGTEPILVTAFATTNAANQAIISANNADIRSRYFGAYDYIDLARSTSTGNDGVTLDASFNLGDGLHMNRDGQIAAANYAATSDIPLLDAGA